MGPPPFQHPHRGWNPRSRSWAIQVKDDSKTLQKRIKKTTKMLCVITSTWPIHKVMVLAVGPPPFDSWHKGKNSWSRSQLFRWRIYILEDPFGPIYLMFDRWGVGPPPFHPQHRGWNPWSRAWAIQVKDDSKTNQKRLQETTKTLRLIMSTWPIHTVMVTAGSRIPKNTTAATAWCKNTDKSLAEHLGPAQTHGIYQADKPLELGCHCRRKPIGQQTTTKRVNSLKTHPLAPHNTSKP